MNHVQAPKLEGTIMALVADTFDLRPGDIALATRPGEVPGWDSLGHSVLLTRLARRYGLDITEDLAMPVGSVRELVELVRTASLKAANG